MRYSYCEKKLKRTRHKIRITSTLIERDFFGFVCLFLLGNIRLHLLSVWTFENNFDYT